MKRLCVMMVVCCWGLTEWYPTFLVRFAEMPESMCGLRVRFMSHDVMVLFLDSFFLYLSVKVRKFRNSQLVFVSSSGPVWSCRPRAFWAASAAPCWAPRWPTPRRGGEPNGVSESKTRSQTRAKHVGTLFVFRVPFWVLRSSGSLPFWSHQVRVSMLRCCITLPDVPGLEVVRTFWSQQFSWLLDTA